MVENELSLTYSSYRLIDIKAKNLGVFITKREINYKNMLKTSSIGCLTAIYDTAKIGKVYMPHIRKRQDYGLWLKILRKVGSTKGMLEPLATYRVLENSVSSNKLKAAQYQWRIYREVESLSLFQSLYYFIQYAYHGVMKYK